LRISEDGQQVEVLADRWEGTRFNILNDVALDLVGNIYFTDPGQSSKEDPTGSVYRYDITTKQVARLDTGLAYPNGLAVTVDQRHLCVGESQEYRVQIYDLTSDGEAKNRRVLVDFPFETEGTFKGGRFFPDGMVFDAENRLYVAMWLGGVINVVDVKSGELLRQYDAGGSKATNCYLHDGWLYTTIAAKEAVFRQKLGVKAFDYNGQP
jgi:gluconolactonase